MFQLLIDSQTQQKFILDNVELLKDILTYHVVAFEISPAFLSSIKHVYQFPTVQGAAPIRINVYREQGSITPFDTIKVIKLSEK
jgi:uncharacterized surface protein with fasciclin (FAS1) repeats